MIAPLAIAREVVDDALLEVVSAVGFPAEDLHAGVAGVGDAGVFADAARSRTPAGDALFKAAVEETVGGVG